MKETILLVLFMFLFFGAMYAYAYREAKLNDKKKNPNTRD